VTRRPIRASALAPEFGIGGRNRRRNDLLPVEADVRILRFERAPHRFVEGLAADSDVGRSPVKVQKAGMRLAAPIRRLEEIEVFIPALVAREP
jgi:hypothetical protein